ncbi:hypothetical protein FSP39_014908 [Pinctada imbricata]|uniref:B box-type domain-containing protein n=1 Tax=Pinctada imbricata TaxID=66713 RepID=A0AA88XUE4_PINIB|nr:hypothetical protein FSP39_014908 [Pinctada imbricata]
MASAPEPGVDQVATLHQYPVVTPCDLCETTEDVNSFCRNCSQNLCDGCKRLHLRSTVSREHNVVHISEGKSSESEATACAKHGERLFFYCRTCTIFFCPKCLNPSHKNHDFLDTDEYAKELQSRVTTVIQEKSKEVEESGRNIQLIEEKKQSFTDTFTNCKTSVINAAKLLHIEVDRVQAELLSTISHHESQCLAKFDEVKQEKKSAEKELQESLDSLLHHSKKHDNISLIAHASKIIDDAQVKKETESDSYFRVPKVDFKSTKIQKNEFHKLFGTLRIQHTDISRKDARYSIEDKGITGNTTERLHLVIDSEIMTNSRRLCSLCRIHHRCRIQEFR